MVSLNDIIKDAKPAVHPLVSDWKRRLAAGPATLEIYQQVKGIGATKTDIILQFTEHGHALPKEVFAWDEDLNAGLISLAIKAVDAEQEAQRFALALRGHMRKIEREFGDGYFSAVFVEFLRGMDVATDPVLSSVLSHTRHVVPPHPSKSENYCREKIASEIRNRYVELTDDLKYTEAVAQKILVKMLALYLDDRFSVSSRRRMGLLKE